MAEGASRGPQRLAREAMVRAAGSADAVDGDEPSLADDHDDRPVRGGVAELELRTRLETHRSTTVLRSPTIGLRSPWTSKALTYISDNF